MQLVAPVSPHRSVRVVVLVIALALGSGGCGDDPAGATCEAAADCNDNSDCTEDLCQSGACVHNVISGNPACDDGCQSGGDCNDGDPCTQDVCEQGSGASVCTHPEIPGCTSDPGPLSGQVTLTVPATGTSFLYGQYSEDEAFSTYLENQAAALADIAVGTCAEQTQTSPGTITLGSVGNMAIMDGTTTIVDVMPTEQNRYEASGFTLAYGDVFDLALSGSPDVTATELDGAVDVPESPAIADLTFINDVIGPTITYDPVDADDLDLVFQYVTGEGAVILRCSLDPAGTSFTIPDATYAAMADAGTIRASTANVRRNTLDAGGTPRDLAVTASTATATGNYTKAP